MKKLLILTLSVLLLTACGAEPVETTRPAETTQVQFGGRSSWAYTWEEFEQMSVEDQAAFQESFGSLDDFEHWRVSVQATRIDIPWNNGGKQPGEYTLAEYEALSDTLQVLFENSFASRADFEAWMLAAQYADIGIPWVEEGRLPADYTWAEFEALTAQQQILFQNSFDSIDEFDRWLTQAQPEETVPAIDTGDKALSDYTWEEFEAMTAAEQMSFQNSFESLEDFDRWMQDARSEASNLPWDNGGKRPEDYTWAEFEALAPDQQIIFQSSFAEENGFELWLEANMPQ